MVTATGAIPGRDFEADRRRDWRRAWKGSAPPPHHPGGVAAVRHQDPAPPELPPEEQLAALGTDDRLDDDEERLDYHTRLTVVATSTLRT